MHLLQIADLGSEHVQLSWQREGDLPRAYPQPLSLRDPLSAEDRAELRWYLEDYLGFPFGAERDRAARVEGRMEAWGEDLFGQVFPRAEADPDPRTYYREAVRAGLRGCELCIHSEDPAFLSLPWELLRDPAPGGRYLAPLLGGLYRRRSGQAIRARQESAPAPGEPFRILLVIARPYEDDIRLSNVARPLLRVLRPLRPQIEIEILRPPTFDALVRKLGEQRGRYQLVHFDGHGVYRRNPPAWAGATIARYSAAPGRGHLVFETTVGGEHVVNSAELGQALADCGVPLFVLNACQSAQEGPADSFSSVASQLVAVGARGVIAMSYSVYAKTAARFMERLYQRLAAHASLSSAVADARQRLYAEPEHPSLIGPLELRDWGVPVLYQEAPGYIPLPPGAGAAAREEEDEDVVAQRQRVEQACPEGQYGFIGRDSDLLRIERALRDDEAPWVLISGLGGSGKTELAYGFARWYAETGGCPGGVFCASFKQKADFAQVVGSIVGYGTDFSRLPEEQQWQILVDHLKQHPCLLVWDNFETVAGYPDAGAADAAFAALADQKERDKLARFARALRGGKSRLLITTRKPEERWLGVAYSLLEIGGLGARDTAELAEKLLRTVGRSPADYRDDPEYGGLLRLLRGHPRSLEVVLPLLRDRSPGQAIEALQQRIEALGNVLEASLSYSFERLSARARRHLPLVGLFSSYVLASVIENFVCTKDQGRTAYQEAVGEALDGTGWQAVLREAAGTGLLRPLSAVIYELHPTLPAFLRRQLVDAAGEAGLARLDGEFLRYYAAWASAYHEQVRNAERDAIVAVQVEEANLLRALVLAERAEDWEPAQNIAQTVNEFYKARGRADEWRALRGRLLRRVGDGAAGRELPAGAGSERASLWVYLLNNEGNEALERNDLDAAQEAYQRILAYLQSSEDLSAEGKIATSYHQLGRVAEERQQYEQAEAWYRRALEIRERLGLERYAANDYHQLGNVAYYQQQYEQAETWYRRALEIEERLGLERDAASDYHQLGMVAQERQQYDQAEAWYRRALEIFERLGPVREAAGDYHQLGRVAEERQQYDQAEAWYRRALEIFERLGLERAAASDYHQLGNVAYYLQQYDQAEARYRRALEIRERLGLERAAATDYHQLGMVAEEWQQYDQAEDWYRRALEIYERLGHPPLLVETLAQFGFLRWHQGRPVEALSWYGRALGIANQYGMLVANQILDHLKALQDELGEQAFAAAWEEAFPGQPPPV